MFIGSYTVINLNIISIKKIPINSKGIPKAFDKTHFEFESLNAA